MSRADIAITRSPQYTHAAAAASARAATTGRGANHTATTAASPRSPYANQ